jgi:hypothetical protein
MHDTNVDVRNLARAAFSPNMQLSRASVAKFCPVTVTT